MCMPLGPRRGGRPRNPKKEQTSSTKKETTKNKGVKDTKD